MLIDIFSDVICPWCYIGKRRLEKGLAGLAPRPRIRWRAFLLNPDMPRDGMEREEYLARKFGTQARGRDLFAAVSQAGAGEGIRFAFDLIRRTPSTVDAHRLIATTDDDPALQDRLVDTLFQAYFEEGADIGRTAVLLQVAARAGLPGEETAAFLATDNGADDVQADNALAHSLGITGVPCFVIDDKYAISGAQAPEVFHRLFESLRQMEPATA